MNRPATNPDQNGTESAPGGLARTGPASLARLSSIRDTVGKALIILFLIKPTIDLFWRFSTVFGGIVLSPTSVSGVLICVIFGLFRFSRSPYSPPFARAIEAFLLLNLLSFCISLFSEDPAKFTDVLNIGIRILASYFIYYTSYSAALRYQYRDISPFVKAIVIGSAIAVVANVAGIALGFGGTKWGDFLGDGRERGLYYDAGVLSNVAVYSLIFSVFLLYALRSQMRWVLLCLVIIILDFYLVSLTKSRAGIIQIAVFGLIYVWMFHRSWGRLLAPVAAVLLLLVTTFIFDVDMSETVERFDTDVAAMEQQTGDVGANSQGKVSLGRFERLGSNRGMLWANALTQILKRPIHEVIFGNFSGSKGHSDYIDVLARNGMVGVLIYFGTMFGLLIRTFQISRHNYQDLASKLTFYGAFALVVCYLLYAVPFRPLLYTTSSWYMWAILGVALARDRLNRLPRPQPQSDAGPSAQSNQPVRRAPLSARSARDERAPVRHPGPHRN